MNVLTARFINYKETSTSVKIRNRSRQTVFLGMHHDVSRDNGYPLLPGQVVTLKKPIIQLYVVR